MASVLHYTQNPLLNNTSMIKEIYISTSLLKMAFYNCFKSQVLEVQKHRIFSRIIKVNLVINGILNMHSNFICIMKYFSLHIKFRKIKVKRINTPNK